MTLAEAPLVLMLVGLAAYAVLGGADFGAAFWQLGARGERGAQLREHAYRAMGPVWEANHVWLVFVLVICWTLPRSLRLHLLDADGAALRRRPRHRPPRHGVRRA